MTAHHRTLAEVKSLTELAPGEKQIFGATIRALKAQHVPFLIAGAFGVYRYSGWWRNTKDMDVLVTIDHFPAAVDVVRAAGLADYYAVEAYDRSWIFRSH